MNKVTFILSKTFSEVTPESAEYGDCSDRGFVWQDIEYTFRELVEELSSGEWLRDGSTQWFTTGYFTECYKTGTEREECLHVKRPDARAERYYKLACKVAGFDYVA